MKILLVGTELVRVEGRTDGRTARHDAANCRFSQFCKSRLKCALAYRNLDRPTYLFVQMMMMIIIIIIVIIIIINRFRLFCSLPTKSE